MGEDPPSRTITISLGFLIPYVGHDVHPNARVPESEFGSLLSQTIMVHTPYDNVRFRKGVGPVSQSSLSMKQESGVDVYITQ
jgi:hypothetical protein